jgi:hypothetical protein
MRWHPKTLIVKHNLRGIYRKDDPTYPWILFAKLVYWASDVGKRRKDKNLCIGFFAGSVILSGIIMWLFLIL